MDNFEPWLLPTPPYFYIDLDNLYSAHWQRWGLGEGWRAVVQNIELDCKERKISTHKQFGIIQALNYEINNIDRFKFIFLIFLLKQALNLKIDKLTVADFSKYEVVFTWAVLRTTNTHDMWPYVVARIHNPHMKSGLYSYHTIAQVLDTFTQNNTS